MRGGIEEGRFGMSWRKRWKRVGEDERKKARREKDIG